MSLVKLSTIPESYFIDIGTESRAYIEVILPAFNNIGQGKPVAQFQKKELKQLKVTLEQSLLEHVNNFKPGEGRGELKTIFEKEYLLTLLNKEHRLISTLHNTHEMIAFCLKNNYAMEVVYFY
ncbi:MAG: hypothetical protein ABIQ40_17070 [Bacteroidia bacterium]